MWVWYLGQEHTSEVIILNLTLAFLPRESDGERSLKATVHRASRSQTWLNRLSTLACMSNNIVYHFYYYLKSMSEFLIISNARYWLSFFYFHVWSNVMIQFAILEFLNMDFVLNQNKVICTEASSPYLSNLSPRLLPT